MLVAHNIQYQINSTPILHDISAQFTPGFLYGIVGHNGSGKSSFIKLLAKQNAPISGHIKLEEMALSDYAHKQLAKKLSYLPQYLPSDVNLSVTELVKLGRFAWKGMMGRYSDEDEQIILQSLRQTNTQQFKDRFLDSLSGGERQRVWLSMCLAQQSQYLLLDEPLSALDIHHQMDVMALLQQVAHKHQIAVIIVLHDINLASEFCDYLLAFKKGHLIYDLPSQEVMTPAILEQIYEIPFSVMPHPIRGHMVALP